MGNDLGCGLQHTGGRGSYACGGIARGRCAGFKKREQWDARRISPLRTAVRRTRVYKSELEMNSVRGPRQNGLARSQGRRYFQGRDQWSVVPVASEMPRKITTKSCLLSMEIRRLW